LKLPIAEIQYDETKAAQIEPEMIETIAKSIKDVGLIHEVIVHSLNITNDGGREVVAGPYRIEVGLKRLLAHKLLGLAEIECKLVPPNSDPDKAEELSIHENLKRANLPWWQEIKLVEAAHALYQKRHDKRKSRSRGRPAAGESDEVWGMRETAAALGMSLGRVSQDISLVKAVEQDPGLRNVKDKRTAMKLVRNTVKRFIAEEETGGDDAFTGGVVPRNDLLFGDSRVVLAQLPNQCFDACVTDPPWLRFQGRTELEKDEATDRVFVEVFRVLRFNTFLYAFVGFEDWYYYREYLPRIGFTVSKTPLVWAKEGAMSPVGVAAWEYNRNFELILLAVKGTPALTKSVNQSGVLTHKIVPPRNMIHPHEKPVGLMQKLIGDCTYEGASILDPFAGSAACLEAAVTMKRTYLGIERDREAYLKGRARLNLKQE
jgi:adenine-specific DNA-methyltransferase